MSYYEFASDSGTGYGSLETFYGVRVVTEQGDIGAGWYWWPCFPGCLPDGDAVGPFQTEREAVEDAGGIWDDLSENNGAIHE
jgi:hypothetical protein